MTTFKDRLESILDKLVDKTFGLHSLQVKEVTKANQAIIDLFLEIVPEKKNLLMAAKVDSVTWGAIMEGYNQAIEDITNKLKGDN